MNKLRSRYAIQLIEEALLLVASMAMLALLFGGIDAILRKTSETTGNMWNAISETINNLFSFLWK